MRSIASWYVMQIYEHVNIARHELVTMKEPVLTLLAFLSHEVTTSRKLAMNGPWQPE